MERSVGGYQNKIFIGIFGSAVYVFFAFPFFPFDWIVLILVRLETSLSPLHKLLDVLVINTDDVTSDTRDMDPHGWIWAVE